MSEPVKVSDERLAELIAKLANLETAVNELGATMAQVALLESMIPPRVFRLLNEATKVAERVLGDPKPTIVAKDAKLARQAELLGECRVIVECWREEVYLNSGDVREYDELLNRIDAALGKGGDDA